MLSRFVDKTRCARPGGAWVYSGRAALLRGPNITAAQQGRPTGIVKQPDKHASFYLLRLKVVAGAGIAPAFAPSKGAVLRLDDPAGGKGKNKNAE